MASKEGISESGGSLMALEMTQRTETQSQEVFFRDLAEFIKQAMNNQIEIINNFTAIMEQKLTELVEYKKATEDVFEGKHNDNVGDILIKTEKLELADPQESSNPLPALLELTDRTFLKYNLEQKEEGTDQLYEVSDKDDLAEAFTQLIEMQQLDFSLQTDRVNSLFYELTVYTSKKSRYGGSKS